MSKIDEKIVQQACDSLVYKYLVEKGHFKTAELLKEERKDLYNLNSKKDEKISEAFSCMIEEYWKLNTVSNNLVYNYLKEHDNPKIQTIALKLKSLVLCDGRLYEIQTSQHAYPYEMYCLHFMWSCFMPYQNGDFRKAQSSILHF